MAYSYSDSVASGLTALFQVPFGYLDKANVTVTVNNVPTPFSWFSDGMVQLGYTPAGGLPVRVSRNTPIDAPDVVFQDGALSPIDLNTSATQLFFAAQEVSDLLTSRLPADIVAMEAIREAVVAAAADAQTQANNAQTQVNIAISTVQAAQALYGLAGDFGFILDSTSSLPADYGAIT